MATKLTKTVVGKLKAPDPSGKQRLVWDADLKGFGVLLSGKTTAKTYIAQRRMPNGVVRRVTVGGVGEFTDDDPESDPPRLSGVEKARRKAGQIINELREGRDHKAEIRKAAAQDKTLRAWLDEYLKRKKNLRERTITLYRDSVERHLETWLDNPLREIAPDMVEERHAGIGRAGGEAAANNAMRALRAIWNFALDRDDKLPANPVRRLKNDGWFKLPARVRHVRSDDLPRFYGAVDSLPSRTARDYLLLLLFTGLRRREAASLRWADIDFSNRVIRLPAARTKAGRKLDLPMSSFVRDLLVARRALGHEGEFIFAADSKSGHIEEPKFPLAQVAKATGIAISVHDLRRSYITIAEATDISPLALKALVNHALGNDVTAGYVQITAERLREPAQRVCDKLMELCRIEQPNGVAKVGAAS
jgi:integrase